MLTGHLLQFVIACKLEGKRGQNDPPYSRVQIKAFSSINNSGAVESAAKPCQLAARAPITKGEKTRYGESNSVVLREPEQYGHKVHEHRKRRKTALVGRQSGFLVCQQACKPGSVWPEITLKRGGHSSCADVAIRLVQPTRTLSPGKGCAKFPSHAVSLFGFAPGGVYRAASRYRSRGGLLPHRFTLTCYKNRRSVFCGTFPGVAPAGR